MATGDIPFSSKFFWIFDLDGTLTMPIHDFDSIRMELDIPHVTDILAHLDSLPEAEASIRRTRLHQIEMDLARKATPSAGAVEMLTKLHESGFQLGILTRNDRDIAILTLETIGVSHYFSNENILGRSEVKPKPDPAGIHHLLSKWGANPSDAVMVGDYLFDLQAGRAAGTTTVHVSRSDDMIWPELTDLSVETLTDLELYF